jgi:hypothetical protein
MEGNLDMTSDLGDLNPATPGAPKKLSDYEGHEVAFTALKLTSAGGLEVNDEQLQLDEVYRGFVEFKVVAVNHVTNNDGKLVRQHVGKVADFQLMDWDSPDGFQQ